MPRGCQVATDIANWLVYHVVISLTWGVFEMFAYVDAKSPKRIGRTAVLYPLPTFRHMGGTQQQRKTKPLALP